VTSDVTARVAAAPVRIAAWLSLPATLGGLSVVVHSYWMQGHFDWLSRVPEVFLLAVVPGALSVPSSAVMLGYACHASRQRRLSWRRVWHRHSAWLVWTFVVWSAAATIVWARYWHPAFAW
jgi:hypothetical protein